MSDKTAMAAQRADLVRKSVRYMKENMGLAQQEAEALGEMLSKQIDIPDTAEELVAWYEVFRKAGTVAVAKVVGMTPAAAVRFLEDLYVKNKEILTKTASVILDKSSGTVTSVTSKQRYENLAQAMADAIEATPVAKRNMSVANLTAIAALAKSKGSLDGRLTKVKNPLNAEQKTQATELYQKFCEGVTRLTGMKKIKLKSVTQAMPSLTRTLYLKFGTMYVNQRVRILLPHIENYYMSTPGGIALKAAYDATQWDLAQLSGGSYVYVKTMDGDFDMPVLMASLAGFRCYGIIQDALSKEKKGKNPTISNGQIKSWSTKLIDDALMASDIEPDYDLDVFNYTVAFCIYYTYRVNGAMITITPAGEVAFQKFMNTGVLNALVEDDPDKAIETIQEILENIMGKGNGTTASEYRGHNRKQRTMTTEERVNDSFKKGMEEAVSRKAEEKGTPARGPRRAAAESAPASEPARVERPRTQRKRRKEPQEEAPLSLFRTRALQLAELAKRPVAPPAEESGAASEEVQT